jgi:hypothetical protein
MCNIAPEFRVTCRLSLGGSPNRRKAVFIDSAVVAAYGSRPNHTALQAALFANSQAALLQLPAKIILHSNSPV